MCSRHDIKDRDAKIHKLNSGLRVQSSECERLQKIVNQHQRAQDRLRQEVEYRIFSLKVRHSSCLLMKHMQHWQMLCLCTDHRYRLLHHNSTPPSA